MRMRPKRFQDGGDVWDAARAAPSSLAALMGQMQPAAQPLAQQGATGALQGAQQWAPPTATPAASLAAAPAGSVNAWGMPMSPAAAPTAVPVADTGTRGLAARMQAQGANPMATQLGVGAPTSGITGPATMPMNQALDFQNRALQNQRALAAAQPSLAQQGAAGALQGAQQWSPPAAGATPGAQPGGFTAVAPTAGLGTGQGAPGTTSPMNQAAMQQALMAQRAQRGGPGAAMGQASLGAAPAGAPSAATALAQPVASNIPPPAPVATSRPPVQANRGVVGANVGTFAKGGSVKGRTFNSAAAAAENLPTHPGAKKLARGGVLRRKPKVEKAALPVPTPPYGDGAAMAPSPTPPPGTAPFRRGGKMAKGGKWIQGAIKHPGALHKQMGVPEGEPIPAKKLAKAAQSSGKLGQRARLAQTLKGMRKAKGGKCDEPDKMAAGGAAKQRRGFPNTNPPPKKYANGGKIRGTGAATKGLRFSGIY